MKIGKTLKYAGLGVAGLLTLVLVAVGGVYGASHLRLTRKHEVVARPVTVSAEADALARGKHLVTTRGCLMPAALGEMTDVELKALWAYLRTISPVPSAN